MRTPIALAVVMAVGTLAPSCGSKSTLGTKPDAAVGSGGGGGQLPMTGGTSGANLGGSGGLPATGGSLGTGGLPATGGNPGTGGIRSPDGGPVADASLADGTSCSCAPGALTWDCYCSAYDCSITLAMFQPDGGLPTSVRAIREYADCNLVVVTYKMGYDPEIYKVFDLTTGDLVGDQQAGDVPLRCPFGDAGTVGKLSAGRFPTADCKVTKCTVGPVGGAYCDTGGTGGSRLDAGPVSGGSSGSIGSGGTGGAGGAGGTGGAGGSDGGSTCACNGGSTTLECFCSAGGILYGCERALSTFTSPGGSPYSTIEEFAGCGLVVVTNVGSSGLQRSVYDRTTGVLVGRRYSSDVIERCPFDGTDTGSRVMTAGRFPEASCQQTSCIEGTQMITFPCPRG